MKKSVLFLCLCLLLAALVSACAGDEPVVSSTEAPEESLVLPVGAPENATVHTADKGVRIIRPKTEKTQVATFNYNEPVTPETIWKYETDIPLKAYTMPDEAALDEDGCIGILSVPSIDLEVKAIDPGGEDMLSVMHIGAAHFASSSAWNGNVALSAHNATADGTPAYFKDLHKLKTGDKMYYTTAFGERGYEVSEIKEIGDTELEYVTERPDSNIITLITCITGRPDMRLMVRAEQVSG